MLLWDRIKQHPIATYLILSTIFGVVLLPALNPGISSTFEDGVVVRSMANADKYQATDTIVFVQVQDGRVVTIALAANTIPPPPRKLAKLRRVKRILFGDYFMLAD